MNSSLATHRSSLPFYVTGGTLSRDAQSYVARQADETLFAGLSAGRFCYVLTSRQMGKSSLMVRTAARLREAGAGVILLDLTAIGQNLSAEQWYGGLLTQIGQQLDLEDELDEFHDSHPKFGPLQRWMQGLRRIVLPHYPGPVVIFIDEIDSVRSLPFSTDEFFAAIREFYNRRTEDEELRRLSFCLLGVAAPSDLIRDTRTTPFNIGERIELHDFNSEEAAPLARGFQQSGDISAELMRRVFYWTNGHPYLTQRLCQAVAEEARADRAEVDRLCRELFLSREAQGRDDNLLFVRERLLRSEADLASLLTLYGQAQRGRQVRDDVTSPLVTLLRLSGIVRVEKGSLKVRNRIYDEVFDQAWVRENMPDAEVRRQREAYRKGALRAAAVAAAIIVVIGALAFAALSQRNRASAEARRADQNFQQASQNANEARRNLAEAERQRLFAEEQKTEAEAQRQTALESQALAEEQRALALTQRDRAAAQEEARRRLLYAAHMNLAARDWQDASVERMRELLAQHRPQPGQPDLRGFEWYLLWALAHPDRQTLRFSRPFSTFSFSPDFRMFATGEAVGVKLWDLFTGKLLHDLRGVGLQGVIEFSPDGKFLVAESADHSLRLWDIVAGRELRRYQGHTESLTSVFFSRDGKLLAATSQDQTARLWEVATGQLRLTLKGHSAVVNTIAFSPDGRKVVTGSDDETVKIHDLATGQELQTFREHPAKGQSRPPSIWRAIFSPDGSRILACGNFMQIAVWEVATGKPLPALGGYEQPPTALTFSPDSRFLATGSLDRKVKLWDAETLRLFSEFIGHGNSIHDLAFSPDSKTLASVSTDNTIKLWDLTAQARPLVRGNAGSVAWAPDGRTLATAQGRSLQIRDTKTWQVTATLPTLNTAAIYCLAYSPDGRSLAAAGEDRIVWLWDVAAGAVRYALRGHAMVIHDVAFAPDGTLLATTSEDQTVRLWDVKTGRELASLTGHEATFSGVAFSPDGRLLATAGRDMSVRLWDVATRRVSATLLGHTGEVDKVAFSPNGRLLATSGFDSTIRLWDVAARKEAAILKGHAGFLRAIAFSPDGKRLASSADDFTIRLWEVETGQQLIALRRDPVPIKSLAFSPDGATLVASSNFNGRMYVYRIATEQEVLARDR
jgi:WD40 repeat protein